MACRARKAEGVSARRFNFDDVRAVVAQYLRGVGAHQHGGEVQYAQAGKGTCGLLRRVFRRCGLLMFWHEKLRVYVESLRIH